MLAILLASCTSNRTAYLSDRSSELNQLSKKDVLKHATVILKGREIKRGILISYDQQQLILHDRSDKKLEIPYQVIEKIQIEENKAWIFVFAEVIGLGYLLCIIGEGLSKLFPEWDIRSATYSCTIFHKNYWL